MQISIGVPLYNGAFLEVTIDSLLAQTSGDFELITSDNASTNQTGEASRSIAWPRSGEIPDAVLAYPPPSSSIRQASLSTSKIPRFRCTGRGLPTGGRYVVAAAEHWVNAILGSSGGSGRIALGRQACLPK